jgi:hypothetical protein
MADIFNFVVGLLAVIYLFCFFMFLFIVWEMKWKIFPDKLIKDYTKARYQRFIRRGWIPLTDLIPSQVWQKMPIRCFEYQCGCIGGKRKLLMRHDFIWPGDRVLYHTFHSQDVGRIAHDAILSSVDILVHPKHICSCSLSGK